MALGTGFCPFLPALRLEVMDTLVFQMALCLAIASTEFTTDNTKWSPIFSAKVKDALDTTTRETSLNSSAQWTPAQTVFPDTTLSAGSSSHNISTTGKKSSHVPLESTTAEKPSHSTAETAARTATQTEMPTSESRDTTTTTITAALTTAKSPAASATSQPVLSTRAMQLSLSERNLTITFSCILGFFALVVVAVKFNRCIHKTQFLHQPLHNIEDLNGSTTGNTLISRGLHDGHPIYDNVPPAGQDEAHFSLEFLH